MRKKHPTRRPASKKRLLDLIGENPDGMGRFFYRCAISILVIAIAIKILIYKDFKTDIISGSIWGLVEISSGVNNLIRKQE